jgi:DNA-binding MarR family transcriptional regulator
VPSKRPDSLLFLLANFKKQFLALSAAEAEVFVNVAQNPGCTSQEIQNQLNIDQPHASRTLSKLVEKKYLRRLNNPKQLRQKVYYLTPVKGMQALNEWIDSSWQKLLNDPDLGLARLCAALESAPISTLSTLKEVLDDQITKASTKQIDSSEVSYCPRVRNQSINKFKLQLNQLNPEAKTLSLSNGQKPR